MAPNTRQTKRRRTITPTAPEKKAKRRVQVEAQPIVDETEVDWRAPSPPIVDENLRLAIVVYEDPNRVKEPAVAVSSDSSESSVDEEISVGEAGKDEREEEEKEEGKEEREEVENKEEGGGKGESVAADFEVPASAVLEEVEVEGANPVEGGSSSRTASDARTRRETMEVRKN